MNLPNKLTVVRLCFVPAFMIVLGLPESVLPWKACALIGAGLFILAALTDLLDGRIARKYGLVTDFGKLMDPLADKFMVIGALIMLLYRYRAFPLDTMLVVVLAVVIFRELAVTGLRLITAAKTGKAVAAKLPGKIKTVMQILFVAAALVEPILWEWIAPSLCSALPLTWVLAGLTVVLTVWSGVDYIVAMWKNIETR